MLFSDLNWTEPSCEELLKAEEKRNEELQAQINRLSLRIQEDLIKYERGESKEKNEGRIMIKLCRICGEYCRPNEFGFCDKHEDTTKRKRREQEEENRMTKLLEDTPPHENNL